MISTALLSQAIALIEQRTGLSVQTQHRANIGELLHDISMGEPESFLRTLRSSDDTSPEWQRLIHVLTIGETYFLRDKRHFEILRGNILPRLTLNRRQANALRLNIWCVGCSTGEEPYSVAATIKEFLPDAAQWQITILGTDLNQRAIETAQKGVFRQWSFRHTPGSFIKHYFTPEERGYRIVEDLQKLVTFRRANLITDPPMAQADVIFCRNVLMYFSKEQVLQAEEILYQALAPGGWLLLGQAEALHSRENPWVMHLHPGTPIYQKPELKNAFQTEPISYPTRPKIAGTQQLETAEESASYAQAVKAVHEDRPQDAERDLSDLLASNPDHSKAHVLLASIFASRQAYPEAEVHIEEALSINALLADAHYIRALINLEQGNVDSVRQCLGAAIYCHRDHALASFTLGNLQAQEGDLMKANKSWRNAYQAIVDLPDEQFVSDLTDMQVVALRGLLEQNLDGEI